MGFWDTVEKVANKSLDLLAIVVNQEAKLTDRMSDEKLEDIIKSSKSSISSVEEMRNAADAAHAFYELRQDRKNNHDD